MRKLKIIILILSIISLNSCFVKRLGKTNTDKNTKQEKVELNFTYSFYEANKQKMLGNYDKAVGHYTKCTELKPNEAAPYYELAGIATSYNDLTSAQKYAEKAYKLNPRNKWYKIMLADVSKRQGNLKRTVELLEELAKEYPDISEYHLEIATTYIAMNKPNEALKEYEFIEKQYGESELIAYEKERLFSKMGDFSSSRKELEKLIKLNPSEANYYGLLAESYLSSGNTKQAKKVYDMLLQVDPDNGIAFLSLSEYYRVTEKEDSSFMYLQKSFASDDVSIDTKVQILVNNYIRVLSVGDKKTKAVQLLSILEKKYPEEAKIYVLKSDFLLQDDRLDEASVELRKSLKYDKNNRNVWEQLLTIEYQQQDFVNLEKDSKKAVEYYPNYAAFYLYNGIAAFYQKKYSQSISMFKLGLNYVVNNDVQLMQFYIYLGDVYDAAKDFENSDKYFDKVLVIDPDNDRVLNNYSYYLAVRNDKIEQAEKMSKKVVSRNPGNANYLDTYAWVIYKKGEFENAEKQLEKAIKLGGDKSAAIMEHYGDALYKNNKVDKAVEAWKNANKIDASEEL